MSERRRPDLQRWARVQVEGFCFGREGATAVVVRRHIIGADGKPTGSVWVREGKGPARQLHPPSEAAPKPHPEA